MNSIVRIIEEWENNDFQVVTHSSGNAAQALALAATTYIQSGHAENCTRNKKRKRLLVMVRRYTNVKALHKLVTFIQKKVTACPKNKSHHKTKKVFLFQYLQHPVFYKNAMCFENLFFLFVCFFQNT